MRDLVSCIAAVPAIAPAVLNATTNSGSIDLKGFDSAVVSISVAAGGITFTGTNKVEFVLTHSSDDVTYVPVTAADVRLGTNADAAVGTGGIVRSLIAAHAAPSVAEVGYIGWRRYLKVSAVFGGTHATGTGIAVNVIKGHPASKPA